jgi:hypothetical protein
MVRQTDASGVIRCTWCDPVHLGKERLPGEEAAADERDHPLDPGLAPHRQLHLIRSIGTGVSG